MKTEEQRIARAMRAEGCSVKEIARTLGVAQVIREHLGPRRPADR